MKKVFIIVLIIVIISLITYTCLIPKESFNSGGLSSVLVSDPKGDLTTVSSLGLDNVNSRNVVVRQNTNVAGSLSVSGNATVIGNLNVSGIVKQAGHQLLPPGSIIMWNSDSPPVGWALCDGTSRNIGGVQINVPDLRGRFVLGAGQGHGGLTNRVTGQTGGAETHTLTPNEMPSHAHSGPVITGNFSGTTSSAGAHTHTATFNVYGNDGGCCHNYSNTGSGHSVTTSTNGNHTHTVTGRFTSNPFTTSASGSGQAHNNMPPFYVLTFIIKL